MKRGKNNLNGKINILGRVVDGESEKVVVVRGVGRRVVSATLGCPLKGPNSQVKEQLHRG